MEPTTFWIQAGPVSRRPPSAAAFDAIIPHSMNERIILVFLSRIIPLLSPNLDVGKRAIRCCLFRGVAVKVSREKRTSFSP